MPRVTFMRIPRVKLPRIPVPPRFYLHPRGPRSVKPYTFASEDIAPDSWEGSQPEWWVYLWLVRRGLREGVDFDYQRPIEGGRTVPGGNVLDFAVRSPLAGLLAWRVQGYYWHLAQGPAVKAGDFIRRLRLQRLGYTVVDILDKDIEDIANRNYVLNEAYHGRELFTISQFYFGGQQH